MNVIHTKFIRLISGIIFSGFLISLPVYAEEAKTGVDLIAEIEPTLQVIIPTSISLNLTPNLDGSPVFVSRDLNILVATNNPTGYHLSLQTDSTNLTNNQKDKEGNYPVLETISSELSEADFTVNRWGYKHNTTNYLPFQTNINLSSTHTPTNEDNITLTFGAKVDITKPAGTYSLALNFHAVTNMIPGVETIIFNPNGGTGAMANQQIEAGTSQNLSQNQFTRDGYLFLGWGTSSSGGPVYGDMAEYYTTLTADNTTKILFAQWEEATMQSYTLEKCQNGASNESVTLVDERDGNKYTVRHHDGACWMTQNLRFDLANNATLDPSTTNVSSRITISSVGDLSTGESYTEARVHASDNLEEYWYNYCAASAGSICNEASLSDVTSSICPAGWVLPTYGTFASIANDSGLLSFEGEGFYTNSLSTGSGGWWSSSPYSAGNGIYRYNLWHTSSSGLLNGDMIMRKSLGLYVRCVRVDIPGTLNITFNGNGATSGSMASQNITAGTSVSLSPNQYTKTGYTFIGWNTKSDDTGTLYENGSTYSVPITSNNYSIVLYAQWAENVGNIQNLTLSSCRTKASGSHVAATDTRDGNIYTVRYINNACWMTQNLRIAEGTTLTSGNSNVASSYTIPTTDTTSGSSETSGRVHNSGNALQGYWYNYCAASAGTICTKTTSETRYSICPSGWRLPTSSEQSALANYVSIFRPVSGGYYAGTTLMSPSEYGFWWSSTANENGEGRFYLQYNATKGSLSASDLGMVRSNSNYVRCIRTN